MTQPAPRMGMQKAIAAFVTNLAIVLAGFGVSRVGGVELTRLTTPEFVGAFSALLSPVVTPLVVWAVRNRPLAPGDAEVWSHGTRMLLLGAALPLLLGACAPADRGSPGGTGLRIDASRLAAAAVEQIELWNAAGVDPLHLDERTLSLMVAACQSAGMLAAAVDSGGPAGGSLSQRVGNLCAVALAAARPAAAAPPEVGN